MSCIIISYTTILALRLSLLTIMLLGYCIHDVRLMFTCNYSHSIIIHACTKNFNTLILDSNSKKFTIFVQVQYYVVCQLMQLNLSQSSSHIPPCWFPDHTSVSVATVVVSKPHIQHFHNAFFWLVRRIFIKKLLRQSHSQAKLSPFESNFGPELNE